MAYCGILWHTVAYCGILWCTVVYCGVLCSAVAVEVGRCSHHSVQCSGCGGASVLTVVLTRVRAHTRSRRESRVSLGWSKFTRKMWFIFGQTITVHCMGTPNTEVYVYTVGGRNEQSWVPTKEVKLLQNNLGRVKSHSPRGLFMTKWPSEAPKSMINPQIIH